MPAAAVSSARASAFARGCAVDARSTARAREGRRARALVVRAQEIQVSVDKPLGLTFKERGDGRPGVQIAGCKGNAAKAGLKAGDVVKYHSSFFGDELWPADALAFTRSAISACPNTVDFIVVRGQADFDVKRLPKLPAPPKFGRKLSAAQKERASHICVDCGYVYTLPTPFGEQPKSYVCPQCNAPKSRFAPYDVETGRAKGGGLSTPIITVVSTVAGLGGMVYFLKDMF
ncbi:Rubredoxin-type fold [Ostreococcus tauri]|uniref:Rubredoxin-type fold n=1 Tax=Ostreococcus tauri TaxID=70448 RepID=Q016L0_OSTTA|nr:Rubredoxin-type fold [Ostreococcus tauri]CAL53651.1 Rubredoxin-type fold [Ostreococcus tauri]|eukprot:XP_003080003.1 Rubredoxin-type fold [Ostreococcus tauri]